MAALSANMVIGFVRQVQKRYEAIDHADWDAARSSYRTGDTAKWQQAVNEAVGPELQEWREIIRVLAQAESYYGGRY
jgi:hypothetical protein